MPSASPTPLPSASSSPSLVFTTDSATPTSLPSMSPDFTGSASPTSLPLVSPDSTGSATPTSLPSASPESTATPFSETPDVTSILTCNATVVMVGESIECVLEPRSNGDPIEASGADVTIDMSSKLMTLDFPPDQVGSELTFRLMAGNVSGNVTVFISVISEPSEFIITDFPDSSSVLECPSSDIAPSTGATCQLFLKKLGLDVYFNVSAINCTTKDGVGTAQVVLADPLVSTSVEVSFTAPSTP
eukprot:CAMPEP_0184346170 /NCGR_PEP_ID=MMETSP1089-20130417/14472_1 /TAXON_ID=38269 ORGANISM="Gloeochaete wittrockiana, Strain SAG46.84" /NCGR_SAMPLE_ID=MMETSP1089 /ASSEMBLY_ACC=CAM_ASM_000445 /LENGTH=244 /DNA_ID=CAMNT_0026676735 /DNA_START=1 /DNA_END=731 /DNA_ORIENTATION=-